MILKEQLVLEKTKADNLAAVRNLNLWGEGLTDVSVVEKMTSIEVLALAANQISTLTPFATCTTLRELYLRKNSITSLGEVKYIKDLPLLRTLWLMDNPCARHPNYRNFLIICCPHLKQLDNIEVTDKEREEARKKLPDKVVQDMLERGTIDICDNGAKPSTPAPNRPVAAKPAEKRVAVVGKVVKEKSNSAPPSREREEHEGAKGGAKAHPSGDGATYTTIQTQRAMLTAIISLVSELTVDSLEMLQKEIRCEIDRKSSHVRSKGNS